MQRTEYYVVGLRNQAHADNFFDKVKQFQHQGDVKIDSDNLILTIENADDKDYIFRLAAFEKIGLASHRHHHKEHGNHDDHGHHHGHHHHHDIDWSKGDRAARNMVIVFFINITFSILEFIFGFLFNSAAILSDAIHDLGDSMSIGLAWIFQKISSRGSDQVYSYGYRRFSLLGAFITSIVLLIGSSLMIVHSIERVFNPVIVNYQGMLWLGIFAIIANGYSAWLISRGSSHNESILSLHLLEDVLGWAGVIIVSIVLHFTDWYFLDPLLSIAIALFIIYKTLPEFLDVSRLFLQAVPSHINLKELRDTIKQVTNVNKVSHFHLWSLDGEAHMISLTVSTSFDDIAVHEQIKNDIRAHLIEQNLTHSNIEIVYDPDDILGGSDECMPGSEAN